MKASAPNLFHLITQQLKGSFRFLLPRHTNLEEYKSKVFRVAFSRFCNFFFDIILGQGFVSLQSYLEQILIITQPFTFRNTKVSKSEDNSD